MSLRVFPLQLHVLASVTCSVSAMSSPTSPGCYDLAVTLTRERGASTSLKLAMEHVLTISNAWALTLCDRNGSGTDKHHAVVVGPAESCSLYFRVSPVNTVDDASAAKLAEIAPDARKDVMAHVSSVAFEVPAGGEAAALVSHPISDLAAPSTKRPALELSRTELSMLRIQNAHEVVKVCVWLLCVVLSVFCAPP